MAEDGCRAFLAGNPETTEKSNVGAEDALSAFSAQLALVRSHASSVVSARFRVGDHAFREADYLQILLWANALNKSPEKLIETLVSSSDYSVGPMKVRPVLSLKVDKGSIISLVWDIRILLFPVSTHETN